MQKYSSEKGMHSLFSYIPDLLGRAYSAHICGVNCDPCCQKLTLKYQMSQQLPSVFSADKGIPISGTPYLSGNESM